MNNPKKGKRQVQNKTNIAKITKENIIRPNLTTMEDNLIKAAFVLGALIALPILSGGIDMLIFLRATPEERAAFAESKKGVIDHVMRKRISPEDIHAAFGLLYSFKTAQHYRTGLRKAVDYIVKKRSKNV